MPRKLRNTELNRLTISQYQQQKKWPFCVLLDNVRSMNNAGSVFRTCDAFNAEQLFLCGITGCPPHREIHKTAIGAEDSVNWEYHSNPVELIKSLKNKNYTIFGVEQTDKSTLLNELIFPDKPVVFIFGNEIDGISEVVLTLCDQLIEIPQYGTKHSLNVAVSAGVVLWDFVNKKQLKQNR